MEKMEEHKAKLKKTDSSVTGAQEQPKKGGLWSLLKLGACCAAPILALAILVPLLRGGTTGLGALAGNLLYFAALLACPLGMYFMMRNMHRTQHDGGGETRAKPDDPKALPPGRGKD